MNTRFLNAPFLAILGLTAALSAHGAIRYVSPTGDDGNSGASWAAPKRTVQAAVNIAASGDTVLVTNGVYALSSTIIITNALVLASVNGPSVTILDGQQTVRVCGVPNAAATINGFTIQNGRAVINGGGIYCNSGAILNCVIANNKATGNENGDGQGGGIYLAYGMVSNCVIFSNTVTSTNVDSYNDTASGGGVYCYSGVVSDCVISNNVCTANYGSGGGVTLSGGQLMHSQLANNSIVALYYADGGGVYADMNGSGYSFVDRCTIVSNSVTATETGAYTTCLAEGGGFYISNATDFRDSLIAGNKAFSTYGFADGGGGRSVGSLVRNCTVVMNQASAPSNPSQGGGMQWGGTDQPVNDIIVFNSASSLPNNSYVNPLTPPLLSIVFSLIHRLSTPRLATFTCKTPLLVSTRAPINPG